MITMQFYVDRTESLLRGIINIPSDLLLLFFFCYQNFKLRLSINKRQSVNLHLFSIN